MSERVRVRVEKEGAVNGPIDGTEVSVKSSTAEGFYNVKVCTLKKTHGLSKYRKLV